MAVVRGRIEPSVAITTQNAHKNRLILCICSETTITTSQVLLSRYCIILILSYSVVRSSSLCCSLCFPKNCYVQDACQLTFCVYVKYTVFVVGSCSSMRVDMKAQFR